MLTIRSAFSSIKTFDDLDALIGKSQLNQPHLNNTSTVTEEVYGKRQRKRKEVAVAHPHVYCVVSLASPLKIAATLPHRASNKFAFLVACYGVKPGTRDMEHMHVIWKGEKKLPVPSHDV